MSPQRNATKADEFGGQRHVYEPHRAGLPPFGPYFRELWRRRGFAFELARTQMRAANTDTVFGQLWLVINPLLLSAVYFLLIMVISGGSVSEDPDAAKAFFALLTSGLFLYYFITGAMQTGTTSVTAGGRLILNTPFPKMLLTVSTTYLAFRRYLPTLVVYLVIHIVCERPWGWQLLWMFPIWAMAVLMGLGLGNLFATLQVYFRDTASFLPYFIRIWLYLSPILWTVEQAEASRDSSRLHELLLTFSPFNPIFGLLGAQGEVLNEGINPSPTLMLYALGWSVLLLVVGSLLLMSREREFAVRL
jgi:teichoic acid transport system permease protein